MPTLDDIQNAIKAILNTKWEQREGTIVPEPEDVQLGNDAVCLEGTVLYADLSDSTALVKGFKDWFVAQVYKSYLTSACRLIRMNNGVITAFDGDRVMGVFIGEYKNSSAAKTALMINYVVKNVVNKLLKEHYPTTGYQLEQAVGIDTGKLFVARTGIRGSNDLVWVGRAANFAAKLCSLRESVNASYITEDVFKMLDDKSRNGGDPKRCMWEKIMWSEQGIPVYRSSWWWKPD
jgi:class 3 adenylate cyclase